MVTLSLTRSRIAAVLADAATLLEADGWDPHTNRLMGAIDQAAGFTPGSGSTDAEQATLNAWETLTRHLNVDCVSAWEQAPGRTALQVLSALHGAAAKAVA
ncbi:hypothetical protein [Streptomyces sp. NPDC088794]|uniref:DUF6197 family protein n=1 Tax=Streptomyces sp. NPDC088794 TaxID=3365902 RepID=UPI00380323F8